MQLSETESKINQVLGVSAEQYVHAKKQRGTLTSPYPDNTDPFEPHDAADGDADGIPSDADDSVEAHAKRAMNHLECALDDDADDEEVMSRIAAARDCLSRAIAKRTGMHSSKTAGLKFAR